MPVHEKGVLRSFCFNSSDAIVQVGYHIYFLIPASSLSNFTCIIAKMILALIVQSFGVIVCVCVCVCVCVSR